MRYALSAVAMIVVLAVSAMDTRAMETSAMDNRARIQSPHGKLDIACTTCHNTESWVIRADPEEFDHGSTGFPLRGAHGKVLCRECHSDLTFAHIGIACADCHLDVHRGQLGVRCENCHLTDSWENRSDQIEQHAQLAFPLVGAHSWVDCGACHRGPLGNEFTNTPADCYACHGEDYAGTTEPDHTAAGFGLNCEMCHPVFSSNWYSTTYPHTDTFPLRGAHARISCKECHPAGFTGASVDCYSCHADDFNAVNDPDHVGGQFPHDCRICHSDERWEPATINHNLTQFPLTGAHLRIDCNLCHVTGYSGTPTECFSCHQDEYNGTADPNHTAAGFNTQCEVCHTTSAWIPSTWDHDSLFPIYTGKHREKWDTCLDCHVVPANFSTFECIFCHEHDNRTELANDHSDVAEYLYESNACYECHPRGDTR